MKILCWLFGHKWVYIDKGDYVDPKAKPCKDFDSKYVFQGYVFYCNKCRQFIIEELENVIYKRRKAK